MGFTHTRSPGNSFINVALCILSGTTTSAAASKVMMPTGFTVHRWRLGLYYEPQTERLILEPASWLATVDVRAESQLIH